MLRLPLALAAMTTLAAPAAAAEIQIASQGPVVELTVDETVRSAPDVAQIGAGVMTRAATAREALDSNSREMERLIARLREFGIARNDIQTSNFNLNPQYDYNRETGEQVFRGYQVTNQVQVKLRDLTRVGEALDLMVSAGANNIYGPNFTLEDDGEATAQARDAAFERGFEMAREYARMAGYSDVRLLEIAERVQADSPIRTQAMAARVAVEDAAPAPPIEPGRVSTTVTIEGKYEMVR